MKIVALWNRLTYRAYIRSQKEFLFHFLEKCSIFLIFLGLI